MGRAPVARNTADAVIRIVESEHAGRGFEHVGVPLQRVIDRIAQANGKSRWAVNSAVRRVIDRGLLVGQVRVHHEAGRIHLKLVGE